jgi:hypothetical protein
MLQNGWAPNLVAKGGISLIEVPYSLPMQSMLGAALVLVTNSSYITVAKYLPLLLAVVFLVIYYSLVSRSLRRFSLPLQTLSITTIWALFSFC